MPSAIGCSRRYRTGTEADGLRIAKDKYDEPMYRLTDEQGTIAANFNDPRTMIRLDDVQVFVLAADAGSFSAAARLADSTPAMVSHAVQRLERELGARLFVRSTRSMRLSDDGERYLPHARALLDALTSGSRALAEGRGDIAGPLRLAVPSDLGRHLLLPWLDAFQAEHPGISLQLRISDRSADLHRHPLDAAVRYGTLDDSGLVALPLAPDNLRVLCAAPEYIARHGAPTHPDELRDHNCLCFVWGDQIHDRWTFALPRGPHTVKVTGNRISDDAEVVRRWGLAGHGIMYKSHVDVVGDLAAGRLVDLLPGMGERAPLNLVSAHRSQLTPAVQRLKDFLRARLDELLR